MCAMAKNRERTSQQQIQMPQRKVGKICEQMLHSRAGPAVGGSGGMHYLTGNKGL